MSYYMDSYEQQDNLKSCHYHYYNVTKANRRKYQPEINMGKEGGIESEAEEKKN